MLETFQVETASDTGDDGGLNSDEASVLAVFGVDIAGQIKNAP